MPSNTLRHLIGEARHFVFCEPRFAYVNKVSLRRWIFTRRASVVTVSVKNSTFCRQTGGDIRWRGFLVGIFLFEDHRVYFAIGDSQSDQNTWAHIMVTVHQLRSRVGSALDTLHAENLGLASKILPY